MYCVAHDKYYIQEAVKELNAYNYTGYLDKIFSFEFSLPLIEVGQIRTVVKTGLTRGLPQVDKLLIDASVDLMAQQTWSCYTDVLIVHPREAERLVSSILFDIKEIVTEVDFVDFYLLQLLKLKFPEVYKLLFDWKRFLRRGDDGVFYAINVSMENGQEMTLLEKYLSKNFELLGIPEHKISIVHIIICHLLDERYDVNLPFNLNLYSYNGFQHVNNHSKYFSLRLDKTCLPTVEFVEARKKTWLIFLDSLETWFESGKINDVFHKLKYDVKHSLYILSWQMLRLQLSRETTKSLFLYW